MKPRRKRRRPIREIHARLRDLRESKGLTLEQVADEVGISKQAVSGWETGVSRPDITHASTLEDLYELPADSLLNEILDDIRAAS